MTWALLTFFFLAGGLLVLFAWSLYQPRKHFPSTLPAAVRDDSPRRHAPHLAQISQSLSPEDIAFLMTRGSRVIARRAAAERRHTAIRYVEVLHEDFRSLFQMGRVLASLSPEIKGREEAERLWLAARFECRYQIVRAMLLLRGSPVLQLQQMTQIVGRLSRRLDAEMAEWGERAALAMEMNSVADRGHPDTF
jgi:hypothetical protein